MRLLSVDSRVCGRDRAALARLIEDAHADIACVHRAPHLLRWRSVSAALGRRSGLVVVGGGRPAGANLLLSSLGVDALGTVDVRSPGAALARLRHGGVEFVLAGARVGGGAAQRVEQAHHLQRAIDRFASGRLPVVLAVDGIDGTGDAAADVLRAGRHEVASGIYVDSAIDAGSATQSHGGAVRAVDLMLDTVRDERDGR